MNKTKKIIISGLACLMTVGVVGCSAKPTTTEDDKGFNAADIAKDFDKAFDESFNETDRKEISAILNGIHSDAYKLIEEKTITGITEEDYLAFAKKYTVWGEENLYLSKKYIGSLANVVDGYDREFDDKLTKWNNVILKNERHEGNLPVTAIKQIQPNRDYSILTTRKSSEFTTISNFTNFTGYGKWERAIGCFERKWFDDVKEYMNENYPDEDYARVFNSTLKYKFDATYPENDIELISGKQDPITDGSKLDEIRSYASNTLDIMLVQTKDGWKLFECKWLYSTRNVDNTEDNIGY